MTLEELDSSSTEDAGDALLQCCGSETWMTGMLVLRPFGDREALHAAADQVWQSLTEEDWLQAFAKHPRIGERGPSSKWSSDEQRGMNSASSKLAHEMQQLNAAYAERFGYTYIVCATGKTAAQMQANLKERLGNNPAEELRLAAAEQAKITHLRLDKLLAV